MDRSPLAIFATVLCVAIALSCRPTGSALAPGTAEASAREGAGEASQKEGTKMGLSEKPITLQQALVISERERMGITSQRLRDEAPDLLHAGGDARVELRSGTESEDRRDRDLLVLVLPAEPINGLKGHFVLTLGAVGAGPVALRHAQALQGEGRISVRLEATPGAELEGRWSYSRRPQMRKVSLAGFDDPSAPFEAEIFHAAEFQQAAVRPMAASSEGGWTRLQFELPAQLLEESKLLDGCEQLVAELDARSGGSFLEWPEDAMSEEKLDEAANEMESRALPAGRQLNLTLEVSGREMIRGKRLQPMVSYPITLRRSDGSRVAATLGCSISGR